MKTRKRWTRMLLVGCAVLVCGCGGNAKKQVTERMENDSLQTAGTVQTRQVGQVKVTWLQDNAEDKLMPASLFAAAPDSLIESLSLEEGIPSTISTFWVETEGVKILFDAGLGAPDSRLPAGLDSIGVKPEEVKYVYLTHFHHDHIGGMLKGGTAVFANAEVYAAKAEYDGWMKMEADRRAEVEMFARVYKDRLHFFEFGDTLPGKVAALEAVGHTPGHTVYQVGKLLVIGDLIHGAALQLGHPDICPSFDMDPEQAVRSRKHYLQYAKDNGLTMAGMHLPAPSVMEPSFTY